MANFPGPYEIEFQLAGWTPPTREHLLRFSVVALGNPVPGSLPSVIDIQKTGGTSAKLDAVANQIWSFYRQAYNTSVTVVGYTLWRYVTGTLAKDFIASGTVSTPAGTSAATIVTAGQVTLTFRAAGGGIMKSVLIESSQPGDTRTTLIPNAAGTPVQRIAAYHLSADNVALARDDTYPIAALRDNRGQNEKIWRKVFRA
jgi:hypothetical protein